MVYHSPEKKSPPNLGVALRKLASARHRSFHYGVYQAYQGRYASFTLLKCRFAPQQKSEISDRFLRSYIPQFFWSGGWLKGVRLWEGRNWTWWNRLSVWEKNIPLSIMDRLCLVSILILCVLNSSLLRRWLKEPFYPQVEDCSSISSWAS